MTDPGRRHVLEALAVGVTVPFAGCGLLQSGRETPDGTTATERPTPTPRRLTWGEAVTTPQGLELSVRGGSFSETYSGARGNGTITPPGDRQFALISVQARNPTSETIRLPSLGYFTVRVDGSTYDVLLDDPGMELPVESGSTRRVELPFLVPPAATSSNIAVWWTPVYENGRLAVVWESG